MKFPRWKRTVSPITDGDKALTSGPLSDRVQAAHERMALAATLAEQEQADQRAFEEELREMQRDFDRRMTEAASAHQALLAEKLAAAEATSRSIEAEEIAADIKAKLVAFEVLAERRRAADPLLRWAALQRIQRRRLTALLAMVLAGMLWAAYAIHYFLPGESFTDPLAWSGPGLAIAVGGGLFALMLTTRELIRLETAGSTKNFVIELVMLAVLTAYILIPAIHQARAYEGFVFAAPMAGVAASLWLWQIECRATHKALRQLAEQTKKDTAA